MINWFHSRMHSPENGWDPVSEDHAANYAREEWSAGVRPELLKTLDEWVGGLTGKTVLDLGGGPGQYSVAFAQMGAKVTWHDVSNRYRAIAEAKAKEAGVDLRLSVGYMDEAPTLLREDFVLVFNRICWNYGRQDASFARVVYGLVKAGGVGYVDTTHAGYRYDTLSASAKLRIRLNNTIWWKIGHPFPPHGRLAGLFLRYRMEKMLVDYSAPMNDRILFRKARQTAPGVSR